MIAIGSSVYAAAEAEPHHSSQKAHTAQLRTSEWTYLICDVDEKSPLKDDFEKLQYNVRFNNNHIQTMRIHQSATEMKWDRDYCFKPIVDKLENYDINGTYTYELSTCRVTSGYIEGYVRHLYENKIDDCKYNDSEAAAPKDEIDVVVKKFLQDGLEKDYCKESTSFDFNLSINRINGSISITSMEDTRYGNDEKSNYTRFTEAYGKCRSGLNPLDKKKF